MEKWVDIKEGIKSIPPQKIKYIELVAEITNLRVFKGLTQAQLAEILEVKQPHIGRFEGLGAVAKTDFVIKALDTLGYELVIQPKKNKEG